MSVIIDGKPAEVGLNDKRWLTLRCSTTNCAVTFDDLYTKVSAAVQEYCGIQINNYWCGDVPLFQLNVLTVNGLQVLLKSRCKLERELSAQISELFRKGKIQLHLQVFLILPSASECDAKVVCVTLENAAQSIKEWESSAAFTFHGVFQQWNSYSRKNKIILDLKDLVEELDEVVEWFQFGIHLKIPHYQLSIIKVDYRNVRDCKIEMFQWWLNNHLEAEWSTVVKALVKLGMRKLANRIAQDHGIPPVYYGDVSEPAPEVEPPAQMDESQCLNKLKTLKTNIENKGKELDKKGKELKLLEKEIDTLTQEKDEMKEASESAQNKVKELTLEKCILKKSLELSEVKSEFHRLSNTSTDRDRDLLADYSKQLEYVEQTLEEERKKKFSLAEELQRNKKDLEEKLVVIQCLTEERDSAIDELEKEKKRAIEESKELALSSPLTQPEDIYHLLLSITETRANCNMKVSMKRFSYEVDILLAFIFVIAGFAMRNICLVALGVTYVSFVYGDRFRDTETDLKELLQTASQENRQKIAKVVEDVAAHHSIPLTFRLVVPKVTSIARQLLIDVRKTLESRDCITTAEDQNFVFDL